MSIVVLFVIRRRARLVNSGCSIVIALVEPVNVEMACGVNTNTSIILHTTPLLMSVSPVNLAWRVSIVSEQAHTPSVHGIPNAVHRPIRPVSSCGFLIVMGRAIAAVRLVGASCGYLGSGGIEIIRRRATAAMVAVLRMLPLLLGGLLGH